MGLDLGVAWAPGLGDPGWGPLLRFAFGAFFFAEGSDPPDDQAWGPRLALEAGALRRFELPGAALVRMGLVGGVEAIPLSVSVPRDDDPCGEALIGPTLRWEVHFLF